MLSTDIQIYGMVCVCVCMCVCMCVFLFYLKTFYCTSVCVITPLLTLFTGGATNVYLTMLTHHQQPYMERTQKYDTSSRGKKAWRV